MYLTSNVGGLIPSRVRGAIDCAAFVYVLNLECGWTYYAVGESEVPQIVQPLSCLILIILGDIKLS